MMFNTLGLIAGLLLFVIFALVGIVVVAMIAYGIYKFRTSNLLSGALLSGSRWRALKRDADAKLSRKQIEEDYKTLVESGGYEVK